MPGSYLLDTNVAIQVLNEEIDLSGPVEAYSCVTVLGELLFGAAKSARPDENRRRIERLVAVCPLVPQGLETARRYGDIKAALREQGRPIPENDVWIAASALEHDLTLATSDHHFEAIDDLRTERW